MNGLGRPSGAVTAQAQGANDFANLVTRGDGSLGIPPPEALVEVFHRLMRHAADLLGRGLAVFGRGRS